MATATRKMTAKERFTSGRTAVATGIAGILAGTTTPEAVMADVADVVPEAIVVTPDVGRDGVAICRYPGCNHPAKNLAGLRVHFRRLHPGATLDLTVYGGFGPKAAVDADDAPMAIDNPAPLPGDDVVEGVRRPRSKMAKGADGKYHAVPVEADEPAPEPVKAPKRNGVRRLPTEPGAIATIEVTVTDKAPAYLLTLTARDRILSDESDVTNVALVAAVKAGVEVRPDGRPARAGVVCLGKKYYPRWRWLVRYDLAGIEGAVPVNA